MFKYHQTLMINVNGTKPCLTWLANPNHLCFRTSSNKVV